MDSFTQSIAPELRSRERSRLIQQIDHALNIQHVDGITHSLLWLADIEALEKMLSTARSPDYWDDVFARVAGAELAKKALKNWLGIANIIGPILDPVSDPELPQSAGSPEPSPPPAESLQTPQKRIPKKRKLRGEDKPPRKALRLSEPSADEGSSAAEGLEQRSKYAKDVARKRDQERCPIVKMGEPIEVARIFPFVIQNEPLQERANFWHVLQTFWSPETIAKWKQHILGPDGSEVPVNLLCLWQSVHGLWGKARFALEPIEMSKDKKSLKVRFWWLPKWKYAKSVRLSSCPPLPSNLDGGPFDVKLWDSVAEKRIQSGHIVTMTTSDPDSMPLPAFQLLHMQWTLLLTCHLPH